MTYRVLLSLLLIVAVANGCASTNPAASDGPSEQSAHTESEEPAYIDSESNDDQSADGPMTTEKLTEVLGGFDNELQQKGNVWQLKVEGVDVIVVADPNADRMRIVAPIAEVSKLQPKQMHVMLEANFHTALDARYATSTGVVYAAFLHPLASLEEKDLRSAVRQVVSLVQTFGDTYSSGELVFPG